MRLSKYDYSQEGAYYVTICTQDRRCMFGVIRDGMLVLNDYGCIADRCWREIPVHFPHVILDEFVIMPNHVHGILLISNKRNGGTRHAVSQQEARTFGKPEHGSLSTIMRSFKSAVTKQINLMRNTNIARIWQGRFYEHIIRNEKSYDAIRRYITENPRQWPNNEDNPDNMKNTG